MNAAKGGTNVSMAERKKNRLRTCLTLWLSKKRIIFASQIKIIGNDSN
jgi:hypothetical protein